MDHELSTKMRIEKPVVIIGAPRAGTTLLFSILSSHPDMWSLHRESGIVGKRFHPAKFDWDRGNVLGAEDASDEIIETLRLEFYKRAINVQAMFPNSCSRIYTNRSWERINRKIHEVLIAPVLKPKKIRIAEKTPKNCLRVPFMNALFPDAFFVFLERDPCTNISSLMEGWREIGRYETYHVPGGVKIEGYSGSAWNFVLPPGWREYSMGVRLEEVCAFQYRVANHTALEDLSHIPEGRWMTVCYEDLVGAPKETVKQLCDVIGLDYVGGLRKWAEEMPPVNITSLPDSEKWKKNESAVMSVIESVRDIAGRMGYLT